MPFLTPGMSPAAVDATLHSYFAFTSPGGPAPLTDPVLVSLCSAEANTAEVQRQVCGEAVSRLIGMYASDRDLTDVSLTTVIQFVFRRISSVLDANGRILVSPKCSAAIQALLAQRDLLHHTREALHAVISCLSLRDMQVRAAHALQLPGHNASLPALPHPSLTAPPPMYVYLHVACRPAAIAGSQRDLSCGC